MLGPKLRVFEEKPGRRSAAAKLLTEVEARRIAANIAKLPLVAVPPVTLRSYNAYPWGGLAKNCCSLVVTCDRAFVVIDPPCCSGKPAAMN
jgi:hypothetical protein